MKSKYIFLALILLVSCASESKYPIETKALNNYVALNFPDISAKKEFSKVLLIPKIGCNPCVQKAWGLVTGFSSDSLIVITNDYSRTSTNIENLYFEPPSSENKMEDLFFFDIYPLLVELESNGDIISMNHLSPGSDSTFDLFFEKE